MARYLYKSGDYRRVVGVHGAADAQEPYRSAFRRDYARLVHSPAFRRLQGKTQLFPARESDFFRNRPTHSLEVAQIAKSIAIRINSTHRYFRSHPIDTDLVETAALAHDLGHPPFGHNGEFALNECMMSAGGFEGNAQTLRILAKLEKRQTRTYQHSDVPVPVMDGKDNRVGLNLTLRTLASVLKYDRPIPIKQNEPRVVKGYYYTEEGLVTEIKKHVGAELGKPFKTVECSIMDVADDIAYSTYDLEDSFKARFLSPLTMMAANDALVENVAARITERLTTFYPSLEPEQKVCDIGDVYTILVGTFADAFNVGEDVFTDVAHGLDTQTAAAVISAQAADSSEKMASSGYYRTKLTSEFVGSFIRGVKVDLDEKHPALSRVYLDVETFKRVEVLKNFAYQALIMSPMLKVTEHRGKDIVKQIFGAIAGEDGHLLMPEDFQMLHRDVAEDAEKERVICDFIAGMTDRYAIQFYGRLIGTNPETIYSPL